MTEEKLLQIVFSTMREYHLDVVKPKRKIALGALAGAMIGITPGAFSGCFAESDLCMKAPPINEDIEEFIASVRTLMEHARKIDGVVTVNSLLSCVSEMEDKEGVDLSELMDELKSLSDEMLLKRKQGKAGTVPECRFSDEELSPYHFHGDKRLVVAIMDTMIAEKYSGGEPLDFAIGFLLVLTNKKKTIWDDSVNKYIKMFNTLWKCKVKANTITTFLQRNTEDYKLWNKGVSHKRNLIACEFLVRLKAYTKSGK